MLTEYVQTSILLKTARQIPIRLDISDFLFINIFFFLGE